MVSARGIAPESSPEAPVKEEAGKGVALERAVASVYRGTLEDFVRRRDALARELRAAGQRDDAKAVKSLRKPSAVAWALDAAALDGPIDVLVAAVETVIATQGGDGRRAIADLRAAVREFAGHAARAATEAGQRSDPQELTNAVFAVLGSREAFDALRRGSLVAVPEGGGLDLLMSLPMQADAAPRPRKPAAAAPAPRRPPPRPEGAVEAQAAARETVRKLAIARDAARARAADAERAVERLQSKVEQAEERLHRAEQEAGTLREQRDRASEDAEAAATQRLDAERAAAEAERHLDRLLAVPPVQ